MNQIYLDTVRLLTQVAPIVLECYSDERQNKPSVKDLQTLHSEPTALRQLPHYRHSFRLYQSVFAIQIALDGQRTKLLILLYVLAMVNRSVESKARLRNLCNGEK